MIIPRGPMLPADQHCFICCGPCRLRRDSDGTATAAACEDMPIPQDCQARAESIAQPSSEDTADLKASTNSREMEK